MTQDQRRLAAKIRQEGNALVCAPEPISAEHLQLLTGVEATMVELNIACRPFLDPVKRKHFMNPATAQAFREAQLAYVADDLNNFAWIAAVTKAMLQRDTTKLSKIGYQKWHERLRDRAILDKTEVDQEPFDA
jgi:hypothetical protein